MLVITEYLRKIPSILRFGIIASAVILLSGTVYAQSTTALSPQPDASATGQSIPNAFSSVPAGFNPLTASDLQLQTYGFPLPPPSSQPQALAAWKQAMAAARVEVSSSTGTSIESPNHEANATATATAVSTNNWGGYAAIGSNNNDVLYTETSANWIVPSVTANSSFPNSDYKTAPAIALWTGIGGVNGSSDVDQAGVASISTATPQYRFWYEDAPAFSPQYEGPTVSPGDEIYVDVAFDTSNYTTDYFLENMTTGAYEPFDVSTPDWSDVASQSSADFIAENHSNGLYAVPSFSATGFSNCDEDTFNLQFSTLDASNATEFTTPGVSVGTINPDTNGFSVTYSG